MSRTRPRTSRIAWRWWAGQARNGAKLVGRGGCAPHQKAIVALDDLDRPVSLERVEEKPAIGVLLIQEHHRNAP